MRWRIATRCACVTRWLWVSSVHSKTQEKGKRSREKNIEKNSQHDHSFDSVANCRSPHRQHLETSQFNVKILIFGGTLTSALDEEKNRSENWDDEESRGVYEECKKLPPFDQCCYESFVRCQLCSTQQSHFFCRCSNENFAFLVVCSSSAIVRRSS